MMKKSKVMEGRIEKAIDEKTNLLKNIDSIIIFQNGKINVKFK